jgi:hypothetical protein
MAERALVISVKRGLSAATTAVTAQLELGPLGISDRKEIALMLK